MLELSSYQVHAKKYRALARGYAALRSRFAEPVQGAIKAYEQLAARAEQGIGAEIRDSTTAALPGK